MYIVPPYQSSVTLFGRDGTVKTYKTLKAAYKDLGAWFITNKVGEHFRVFSHMAHFYVPNDGKELKFERREVYDEFDYVMRNDFGQPVTRNDFAHLRPRYRISWRWGLALNNWNGEGPVPGVHRSRGGHYHRRMHTTPQRRQAQVMDEFEVPPRAARNATNLPNTWDDYNVSSRDDRSWKRFRKTRWKAV